MSTSTQPTPLTDISLRALALGAAAGVGGGIVFGIMMAMMGMLPMVAMLVGRSDIVTGWLVHLLISAAFGAVYGVTVLLFKLPSTTGMSVTAGAVAGVVFWVAGALVAMPLMLGMSAMVLRIEQPQIMSLVGHILYGVITGVVFTRLIGR